MTKSIWLSGKPNRNKKADAHASTDCPKCGGFVRLKGQGRPGQKIRLEGKCPKGHLVYFMHTI